MKSFKLALIGGGGISRAHVAAAKASNGRLQFVAAADPSESARRGLADSLSIQTFGSASEMLAERASLGLNGVVVCTPPSQRIAIVAETLALGLPTLVEKPLAHTLDDATSLAVLARGHSGVASAVAYCHRFVPAVLEMKRQLQSGKLGQPIRFENTFAGPNPGVREKWMSDPKISGGGSFIDTGCHSLDLFRFLLGDASVASAIYAHHWPGRAESSSTVMIKGAAESHVAGVILSGWTEPGRFTLTVVGTDGLLSYDYDKPTELLHRPTKGDGRVIAVESHESRFDRQLVDFARFAETGTRGAQLASFEDGRAVAKLVDDAQKLAGTH